MATSADLLCKYAPPAFRQFTEAVVNLKFDEEPKYTAYVSLFEPLCGPGPARPILLEEKARVGQKRGREAIEQQEDMEIVRTLHLLHMSDALYVLVIRLLLSSCRAMHLMMIAKVGCATSNGRLFAGRHLA